VLEREPVKTGIQEPTLNLSAIRVLLNQEVIGLNGRPIPGYSSLRPCRKAIFQHHQQDSLIRVREAVGDGRVGKEFR
jgi:hypothetical protein